MTARNRTRSRNTAATVRTKHELDQVVLDDAKKAMKGTAAPVLARIVKAEKLAKKSIAKREAFLKVSGDYKNDVREAYDEGDASALNKVDAKIDAYENSLLRPSRRK